MRTEVQHQGEGAAHGGQPLDNVVGHAREQELVPGGVPGDPVAPLAQQPSIENVGIACHDAACPRAPLRAMMRTSRGQHNAHARRRHALRAVPARDTGAGCRAPDTRQHRRPDRATVLPRVPRVARHPMCCAGRAGARCTSYAPRCATSPAYRCLTVLASAWCRPARWPILPPTTGPVPWRASAAPCAHSCTISSMPTGTMRARCSAVAGGGWGDLRPGIDVIVPVPMSRLRLLLRRFNQSAVLAGELARQTGIAVDPHCWPERGRPGGQVGLTRDQRRRNVAGAFRVRPAVADLQGRNVLLIDDVITTGATVNAVPDPKAGRRPASTCWCSAWSRTWPYSRPRRRRLCVKGLPTHPRRGRREALHCTSDQAGRGEPDVARLSAYGPRRSGADAHRPHRREEPGDASALVREAARQGATYVQTPEITTLMEMDRERLFAAIRPEAGQPRDPPFRRTRARARDLAAIGSMRSFSPRAK